VTEPSLLSPKDAVTRPPRQQAGRRTRLRYALIFAVTVLFMVPAAWLRSQNHMGMSAADILITAVLAAVVVFLLRYFAFEWLFGDGRPPTTIACADLGIAHCRFVACGSNVRRAEYAMLEHLRDRHPERIAGLTSEQRSQLESQIRAASVKAVRGSRREAEAAQ
jgi:hypothetical protein